MRRFVLLLVLVLALALAGCGGGDVGRKTEVTHHQPNIDARLTGKAAARAGERTCRALPENVVPDGSRADKVAALRAYLQKQHPRDDIRSMLRGCLRTAPNLR